MVIIACHSLHEGKHTIFMTCRSTYEKWGNLEYKSLKPYYTICHLDMPEFNCSSSNFTRAHANTCLLLNFTVNDLCENSLIEVACHAALSRSQMWLFCSAQQSAANCRLCCKFTINGDLCPLLFLFLFRPPLDKDLVAFALMMDDLAAFCRSRPLSLLRCQLCLDLHILHTSTCAYLSGHVAFWKANLTWAFPINSSRFMRITELIRTARWDLISHVICLKSLPHFSEPGGSI